MPLATQCCDLLSGLNVTDFAVLHGMRAAMPWTPPCYSYNFIKTCIDTLASRGLDEPGLYVPLVPKSQHAPFPHARTSKHIQAAEHAI